MMAMIRAGRFDRFRAKNCGDQFVGHKRVLRSDDLIAGLEKRVTEKFNHFVRTVAQNEMTARDA